ncbi:two-component system, OmpR family, response regulator [Yoonia rosea]|uniref:Two-component system, OmpR family, response regulator n=1 Tax=Yoonia rosea TaxID=287098 RepID=A0A1R3XHC9_9RHOB|nr:response regulator transcription factor [Yoonia rosea]SIT90846.1 two-component system, OmpR family, response regulator [Yoonia rosea]
MILVADDDTQIRDVVRIALTQAGFGVAEAPDGRAALEKAESLRPDLIILDIGMPEMDGLEVCRTLRRTSEVPILFLTAHADEIDRVVGLELGADDYVAKPFSPRELVARVRAILKRTQGEVVAQTVLRRGILSVDPARHLCHVGDDTVLLTAREMDLLERLIARPDHVMSRPQLVDAIYGTNVHVSDRTMDSHLRNLRSKLGQAGCPDAIETVHGVGIRMGACRGA